jgi:hypothetical protein
MTGTSGPAAGEYPSDALLGIYLNDHLAGATGGVELFRRAAGAHRGSPVGGTLERLAEEVAADRAALVELMSRLGVPVRHYKVYAAWAVERVGRLKLNGRVLGRSPLSSLVELEGMRLGVEGKAALWTALRALADRDPRLDPARLDRLAARAREQADTLEEMRLRTAVDVLRSP